MLLSLITYLPSDHHSKICCSFHWFQIFTKSSLYEYLWNWFLPTAEERRSKASNHSSTVISFHIHEYTPIGICLCVSVWIWVSFLGFPYFGSNWWFSMCSPLLLHLYCSSAWMLFGSSWLSSLNSSFVFSSFIICFEFFLKNKCFCFLH